MTFKSFWYESTARVTVAKLACVHPPPPLKKNRKRTIPDFSWAKYISLIRVADWSSLHKNCWLKKLLHQTYCGVNLQQYFGSAVGVFRYLKNLCFFPAFYRKERRIQLFVASDPGVVAAGYWPSCWIPLLQVTYINMWFQFLNTLKN